MTTSSVQTTGVVVLKAFTTTLWLVNSTTYFKCIIHKEKRALENGC